MNLAQVARLLAGIAALLTLAQLPALLFACLEPASHGLDPAGGFVASIAIGVVVAALLWLGGRGTGKQPVYRKEAIAVAGLAWVLAGMLGAVPLQWSGVLPNAVDAVFETISGLTTCGATVLGSGDNLAIEQVPQSVLLWRAMLQWIGGLGIVLVFAALLPAMGATSKNLLTSEAVGVGTETYQPRVLDKARMILFLYLGGTLACALCLVLFGGFGWFDAICHAFTALSTGGYSTRSSLAAFDSLGGEIVLTVFMFLGGASLAVIATHLRTGLGCLPALLRTGEFRLYAILTGILVLTLTVSLLAAGLPLGTALRQATFNGVSVLTSTGYATADFQVWPTLCLVALFSAMFLGGCTGSTAGGIKMVRALVVLKLCAYTVRHFVRPKSVERIKLDEEVLPAAMISSILAIVLLWIVAVLVGGALISFDDKLNFVAALSASASMLGSTGPALTLVEPASAAEVLLHGGTAKTLAGMANVGPFGGYGELQTGSKLVLMAQMVLGRLELLTILALFTPSFWRR